MNIQGCFPLGLTGLIPLQSQGPSRVVSNKHHNSKASILYLASSTDFNYKYCQWFLTLFFIFDHWSRFITVTHRWKLKQAFWKMEKDMTTHSSVLAWRIPGTREPGGLPSMGSHRFGHDWSDLAAAGVRKMIHSFRLFMCLCWCLSSCNQEIVTLLSLVIIFKAHEKNLSENI